MQGLLRTVVVAGLLGLPLGGCLRPLYGAPEFGGLAVQRGLAGIKVEIEGERLAHYVRNELEFQLRGGDPVEAAATHRLVVRAQQNIGTAIVDRVGGTAESASLIIDARYSLFAIGKPQALTEGDAKVVVSYDRNQQRFAAIRAARDAEIRGGKQLAEQIKVRVASYLASAR